MVVSEETAVHFRTHATCYLASIGWTGGLSEDLVGWMTLEYLTLYPRPFNMALLYTHALDKIDPRHRVPGQVYRPREHTWHHTMLPVAPEPSVDEKYPDSLFWTHLRHCQTLYPNARAWRMLEAHFCHDEPRRVIGQREGLSRKYVDIVLKRLLTRLTRYFTPNYER